MFRHALFLFFPEKATQIQDVILEYRHLIERDLVEVFKKSLGRVIFWLKFGFQKDIRIMGPHSSNSGTKTQK